MSWLVDLEAVVSRLTHPSQASSVVPLTLPCGMVDRSLVQWMLLHLL